jgi:3',5'-nucleoside bisphosphate phosphatase
MPKRDPFTALCQQFAANNQTITADMHSHTSASDGDESPSRLVIRAVQEKLAALAITDHDTTVGVREALKWKTHSDSRPLEIVAGIELSCRWLGRPHEQEVHVLGLFIDVDHDELNAAAEKICSSRKDRFLGFTRALAEQKFVIPQHKIDSTIAISASLGRRHVVNLLIESGFQRSRHSYFTEILPSVAKLVPPKLLLDFHNATRLIRQAGGISILAHPPCEFDKATYLAMKEQGLQGIEIRHAGVSCSQTDFLKQVAEENSWAISAGSDFHGKGNANHTVGRIGLSLAEYSELKRFAGR